MKEAPRIILVEDDPTQREEAVETLLAQIPQANITALATEYGFRRLFPTLVNNPPDIVVTDLLLRWADLEYSPTPADITALGDRAFLTAGIRIHNALFRNPATENVPVLLWSVYDLDCLNQVRFQSDTLGGTYFLTKRGVKEFCINMTQDVTEILVGNTPKHAVLLPDYKYPRS